MATLQLFAHIASDLFGGGEAAGDAAQMDYLSDTIKATLHTTTQTVDSDNDDTFSDWSATELTTANGYTAGGITLSSKTLVFAAASPHATYSCASFLWTASGAGITFRYVLFWDDTPTTPADPLIGYIDTTGSGNQTIAAGNTLTIAPGGSGLFTGAVTGT